MTHETAALIAHGYITEPKPTPRQIAATEAARAALAKFRHQWKVTPAPTR